MSTVAATAAHAPKTCTHSHRHFLLVLAAPQVAECVWPLRPRPPGWSGWAPKKLKPKPCSRRRFHLTAQKLRLLANLPLWYTYGFTTVSHKNRDMSTVAATAAHAPKTCTHSHRHFLLVLAAPQVAECVWPLRPRPHLRELGLRVVHFLLDLGHLARAVLQRHLAVVQVALDCC